MANKPMRLNESGTASQITVRLSDVAYIKMVRLSAIEDRTVSALVRDAIDEYLTER